LPQYIKLSELPQGTAAKVVAINDEHLSLKLLEMGLLPGESVSLEHVAPFGDPIAVRVGEYHMCLRLDDASNVTVEPEQAK
jgi:ferrous iron transport protein A